MFKILCGKILLKINSSFYENVPHIPALRNFVAIKTDNWRALRLNSNNSFEYAKKRIKIKVFRILSYDISNLSIDFSPDETINPYYEIENPFKERKGFTKEYYKKINHEEKNHIGKYEEYKKDKKDIKALLDDTILYSFFVKSGIYNIVEINSMMKKMSTLFLNDEKLSQIESYEDLYYLFGSELLRLSGYLKQEENQDELKESVEDLSVTVG